jgi:hypothetical protein
MPTLYVGRPLLNEVRRRKKKMERDQDIDHVREREALRTMFSADALERVERREDRADD